MTVAMVFSGVGPVFQPTAHAQTGPVGQGFVVDADDVRFIYKQILVAQDHAAGGTLLGSGPNQVADPQLPRGLRTVDGSFNNLVPIPDQHMFGAADRLFPRLTTPNFAPAEAGTTYAQKSGNVIDSKPRVISNLIVDQSVGNPAAVAANANPCGSGGFVCGGGGTSDPTTGELFIPNITPDFGLSAPFNTMFTFFGQFFDHGLDLVTKGGSGAVVMPLQADDPLFNPGPDGIPNNADDPPTNFMVMNRGQNQPGPDGILGTADDIQETMNTTTPWVDQNQTYTSHPSHQVFLRQYQMVGLPARPVADGKVLDGGFCSARGTGFPGDEICNIGNWGQVKAQAATKLGIQLVDQDVFNVPLILTDPYGHFKPGPLRGMPQIVTATGLVEGDPAGGGVAIPSNALRTGHAFLNDIAHSAAPTAGGPDTDLVAGGSLDTPSPAGTYDNELLDLHFITGDGRGNENIALSMVHNLFHAEHNRLVHYIDNVINTQLTPAEVTAWKAVHGPSGWDYGERLFQAARFVTEMEYQHLVFEEFARKVQPLINPFLGGLTSIDGAISAEFAHTVYRLGHSMLPETVARIKADGTDISPRLLNAFLNPAMYNDGGTAAPLPAAEAAGSIIRGLSRQVGNELDEFVTSSVRNTLVGLPLDLPAINIARGRSEGIPRLNVARRQFFAVSQDPTVQPYANWFEFGLGLRHFESLVNFVAAYGTDPTITGATTAAAKRTAAQAIVSAGPIGLMVDPATASGLDDVDFWMGGLAEKPAVFGGLLGSTFNFVFEKQLENLQDGDRFYYLQRTDGLNLRFSLEGNSLAELARRNTDVGGTMDNIFNTADFNFDAAALTGTAPIALGDGIQLLTLVDGTKFFFDPLHTGKNIVFNGGPGDDRFRADVGDDSLFGNGGNDRFDGAEGNDTLNGGAGDDILLGGNGDDILKGGPGNDAMNTGPGFGADLAIGGDGNDFMVGGNDGVEYFGAGGNDIVIDGTMRSEGIFGGAGDDWLFDGDGHDGGLFGDNGNVFDLLAGLDAVGGDDVLGGGPGQDNHFGEGGDDIMLMSEGSNKFFGDFGFDWITQRGWPAPGDIQMNLLAIPALPLNFNDLRNFYRFVDGASGWDLNDNIVGDHNTLDPGAPPELLLKSGMELTVEGAARIAGLPALIAAFGVTAPGTTVTVGTDVRNILFSGGNVLLGGLGSDTISGGGGIDLIDGDRWLNVQLRATLNDGTVRNVDDPRDLIPDVFADPQRLNPGNIVIERTIVTPTAAQVGPADCSAVTPVNCDTAVFDGPRADFVVTRNANGTITVFHSAGVGRFGQALGIAKNDETDTLLNIERLRFTDGDLLVAGATTVPNVVGLTQAAAIAALSAAGLTATVTTAASGTVPVGTVISQTPIAGTSATAGGSVAIVVSVGATPPVVTAAVRGITQGGVTVVAPRLTSAQLAVPNTLLVAFVSAFAPPAGAGANVSVASVANAGGGALVWTRAVRSNAQRGTAEIWWANSPAAHGPTTVTATLSSGRAAMITVVVVTGANPLTAGLAASAPSGAIAASLVTTGPNSLVFGAGIDVDRPRSGLTPGAGQNNVTEFRPEVGGVQWVQRVSAPVPASGTSVTLSESYAGAARPDRWNLALIEIKAR